MTWGTHIFQNILTGIQFSCQIIIIAKQPNAYYLRLYNITNIASYTSITFIPGLLLQALQRHLIPGRTAPAISYHKQLTSPNSSSTFLAQLFSSTFFLKDLYYYIHGLCTNHAFWMIFV